MYESVCISRDNGIESVKKNALKQKLKKIYSEQIYFSKLIDFGK
jgi:hypothetical protein